MRQLVQNLLILAMVFMMPGCEEDIPDYAADIIDTYIIESITYMGETIDLTELPLEDALFVELTRDELKTYENDEDQCLDTYTIETDEIDGVTETSILFSDDTEVGYSVVGGKLRLDDDGDIIMLAPYTGSIPPASWTDPTLLTNDTYEPNNEMAHATTIAAGGTTQNHYLANCGDQDYFMFQAISGTTYILETTTSLSSALDLTLTLYTASGSFIDSDDDDGTGWNPSLYWTCPASGDYYFLIDGFWDDEVGAYTVSVSTSTSLQKVLTQPEEKKPRTSKPVRLSEHLFR